MLTGELRGKIDAVWNAFWAGGIANPLEVIEQITYLLFIRGLDEAQTLAEAKANRTGKPIERRSATQIEFIDMIVEHLTDQGVMDEGLLYEPPFIDIAPTGPEPIFGSERSERIFKTIRSINESAVA